jgi:hypothetical protein
MYSFWFVFFLAEKLLKDTFSLFFHPQLLTISRQPPLLLGHVLYALCKGLPFAMRLHGPSAIFSHISFQSHRNVKHGLRVNESLGQLRILQDWQIIVRQHLHRSQWK